MGRVKDAWVAFTKPEVKSEQKQLASTKQSDLTSNIASQIISIGVGYTSYSARTVLNITNIGYLNNITVYRGVSILAQAIAALEWQVFEKYGQKQRIEGHPLELLMAQPNYKRMRANFMEQLVSYLLIGWQDYLWSVQNDAVSPPLALYNLRPDLVLPEVNLDNQIYNYRYYNKDYSVQYMHPIRFFHPLNEFVGLSPLQVAASVIERQNAGEEWNFNLMSNSARPSGAFVATTDLPPLTRGKMIQEIRKKYGGGRMTACVPLLLENGLTYIQLALSPVDADWFNSDASAGRKILAALGVDSLLVNDKEYSTYNNVAEAKLAMWELTGLNILARLEDELNMWLPPLYSPGGVVSDVELKLDRKPIELLKQNRLADTNIVLSLWNNGLAPFNSCAAEVNQPLIDDVDDFYKFGPTTFIRRSNVAAWLDQQEEAATAAIQAAAMKPPPMLPPPPGQVVVSDITQPPSNALTKRASTLPEEQYDLATGVRHMWAGKLP